MCRNASYLPGTPWLTTSCCITLWRRIWHLQDAGHCCAVLVALQSLAVGNTVAPTHTMIVATLRRTAEAPSVNASETQHVLGITIALTSSACSTSLKSKPRPRHRVGCQSSSEAAPCPGDPVTALAPGVTNSCACRVQGRIISAHHVVHITGSRSFGRWACCGTHTACAPGNMGHPMLLEDELVIRKVVVVAAQRRVRDLQRRVGGSLCKVRPCQRLRRGRQHHGAIDGPVICSAAWMHLFSGGFARTG